MTRYGSWQYRSDSGFALVGTLVVVLVGTIIVTTLLTKVTSTSLAELTTARRDREVRAAEGALALAVNAIRNTPSVGVKPNEECYPFGTPEPARDQNDQPIVSGARQRRNPPKVTVEGVDVVIGCQTQNLEGPGEVARDDGQIALATVGDSDYDDFSSVKPAWRDWERTRSLTPSPSLGLWADKLGALQAPGVPTASSVGPALDGVSGQFIHVGRNELRVIGGALVGSQVAPLRTDPSGSPAISVEGPFRQGGPAIYPSASARQGSELAERGNCGILEAADLWGASFNDVRSTDRTRLQSDRDLAECNVDSGKLSVGVPEPAVRFDNRILQNAANDLLTAGNSRTNDCDSLSTSSNVSISTAAANNLKSGRVIKLEGYFDARATKQLNQWFTDCPATWWFVGDTFFDVYDPTNPDPDKRSALVIDNRESNWVFGASNGWTESTGRPRFTNDGTRDGSFVDACNRNDPSAGTQGATITLSSRTGLKHKQGRVVVCGPKQAGELGSNGVPFHKTAIFQRGSVPLGATFVPAADVLNAGAAGPFVSSNGGTVFDDLKLADDAVQARLVVPGAGCSRWGCFGFNYYSTLFDSFGSWLNAVFGSTTCIESGSCVYYQDLSFRYEGQGLDPNGPALDPKLEIQGYSTNATNGFHSTAISVRTSDGRTCQTQKLTGGNSGLLGPVPQTLIYDLRSGSCGSVIDDNSDLQNSIINIQFGLNPAAIDRVGKTFEAAGCAALMPISFGFANCSSSVPGRSLVIDRVGVRSDWSVSTRPSPIVNPSGCGIPDGTTNPDDFDSVNGNCLPTELPALGFSNAGLSTERGGGSSTTTAPSSAVSYARLRHNGLSDESLVDGWVPVKDLSVELLASSSLLDPGASRITLRLVTPQTEFNPAFGLVTIACSRTLTMQQYLDLRAANPQSPRIPLIENGVSDARCGWGQWANEAVKGSWIPLPSIPPPSSLAIGDLVSWSDLQASNGNASTDPVGRERAILDLEVTLAGGVNKSFSVDSMRLLGSSQSGFERPLAPFSVRWNPMRLNNGFDPEPGDATFHVFGSTVVPLNAVEVRWGSRDNGVRSVRTGYGIFNGGSVADLKCNESDRSGCRPGLIAGAVGSWSTEGGNLLPQEDTVQWTGSPATDPIATSGFYAPANRKILLRACVVTRQGPSPGTWDDETRKRAIADVVIGDLSPEKQLAPGSTVRFARYGANLWDESTLQIGDQMCAIDNQRDG